MSAFENFAVLVSMWSHSVYNRRSVWQTEPWEVFSWKFWRSELFR